MYTWYAFHYHTAAATSSTPISTPPNPTPPATTPPATTPPATTPGLHNLFVPVATYNLLTD